MNVRYRVELSQVERIELNALLSGCKRASREAGGEEIARRVGAGGSSAYRTKRRFVEGNLKRALSEEPLPGAERKITGKEETLVGPPAPAPKPQPVAKTRPRCNIRDAIEVIAKATSRQPITAAA